MDTSSIYTKLLAFQKLGVSIKKDKKNPHFKKDYASLNEVLDKVKKPLNELGVLLLQQVDEIGIITTLHDTESATEVTCRLNFIGATDMQKLGGAITYARRYALVAMLGLEDDDDDGNAASKPVEAPKRPAMTTEEACAVLAKAKTFSDLLDTWEKLPATLKRDPEVVAMKDQRKTEIAANN
jgi:hypothetical protein